MNEVTGTAMSGCYLPFGLPINDVKHLTTCMLRLRNYSQPSARWHGNIGGMSRFREDRLVDSGPHMLFMVLILQKLARYACHVVQTATAVMNLP
jgi:hypothetical protein